MCNVSSYYRTHPVTGFEFDYEHICKTCAHYSERTRKKIEVIGCTLAPEKDGETFDQQRSAFPACTAWQPPMTAVKRKRKGKQR
jgi:hypothetical protein